MSDENIKKLNPSQAGNVIKQALRDCDTCMVGRVDTATENLKVVFQTKDEEKTRYLTIEVNFGPMYGSAYVFTGGITPTMEEVEEEDGIITVTRFKCEKALSFDTQTGRRLMFQIIRSLQSCIH